MFQLSNPSTEDKCMELCNTVMGKDDSAFELFLTALTETGHKKVSDHIREPLTEEQERMSYDQCLHSLELTVKGSSKVLTQPKFLCMM